MLHECNTRSVVEQRFEQATLPLFCDFRQAPSIHRKAIRTVTLKAVEIETDPRLVPQVPHIPVTQPFRHDLTGQNPTVDPERAVKEVCILFDIVCKRIKISKKKMMDFRYSSLQYGCNNEQSLVKIYNKHGSVITMSCKSVT